MVKPLVTSELEDGFQHFAQLGNGLGPASSKVALPIISRSAPCFCKWFDSHVLSDVPPDNIGRGYPGHPSVFWSTPACNEWRVRLLRCKDHFCSSLVRASFISYGKISWSAQLSIHHMVAQCWWLLYGLPIKSHGSTFYWLHGLSCKTACVNQPLQPTLSTDQYFTAETHATLTRFPFSGYLSYKQPLMPLSCWPGPQTCGCGSFIMLNS